MGVGVGVVRIGKVNRARHELVFPLVLHHSSSCSSSAAAARPTNSEYREGRGEGGSKKSNKKVIAEGNIRGALSPQRDAAGLQRGQGRGRRRSMSDSSPAR